MMWCARARRSRLGELLRISICSTDSQDPQDLKTARTSFSSNGFVDLDLDHRNG
jgi:hypothetical protein